MHEIDAEDSGQFESRKQDHIKLSLDPRTEASELRDLDRISLNHEALPEIDFSSVDTQVICLGEKINVPMFVSSMTAGHSSSLNINETLASVCAQRNWMMGVGSQRRELNDKDAQQEWKRIRKKSPSVKLLGNIGITQVIQSPVEDIQRLVDGLEACGLFVHTNPLQECFQPEGTPRFAGGLKALENLCKKISVPVILKEVGCGISRGTFQKLKNVGLTAVDVAGRGGTHWGRIEGYRSQTDAALYQAAQTFKDWGISTVESLISGKSTQPPFHLWASGGVRSGLDVAKLIAVGAHMVGLARPILEAAVRGEEVLDKKMQLLEFELKVALLCTGSKNISELTAENKWAIN